MIRRLAWRVGRDLLAVPLTAVVAWYAVAALPRAADADAKVEALASVARQAEADLGVGRPWGVLVPWRRLLAGERLGDGRRSYTAADLGRALAGSARVGLAALGLALALAAAYAAAAHRARGAAGALLEAAPALAFGTPPFVLALAFAVRLGVSVGDDARDFEPAMAVVVALWPGLFLGTVLRDALRAEAARPSVLAARARGLSEGQALLRHALPNALPALLDALPPVAAALLTGSFAAEKLFNVTSFGFLYVDAARERQLAVVVVATTVFAAVLALAAVAADVGKLLLDPRARAALREER